MRWLEEAAALAVGEEGLGALAAMAAAWGPCAAVTGAKTEAVATKGIGSGVGVGAGAGTYAGRSAFSVGVTEAVHGESDRDRDREVRALPATLPALLLAPGSDVAAAAPAVLASLIKAAAAGAAAVPAAGAAAAVREMRYHIPADLWERLAWQLEATIIA
jgi:hypothetical protein